MFLPIGDENPTLRRPCVNYALIAINVLVFLLVNTRPEGAVVRIIQAHGFTPAAPGLLDALTSLFLHAGVLHLAGNMLYLWIFGDNVEDVLGPALYVPFYLVAGGVATAAQWLMDPHGTLPLVGASGAISGVVGFYGVYFPWRKVKVLYFLGYYGGVARVSAVWFIGLWFLMQLALALLLPHDPALGGVAYWAHLGGIAFGAAVGLLWRLLAHAETGSLASAGPLPPSLEGGWSRLAGLAGLAGAEEPDYAARAGGLPAAGRFRRFAPAADPNALLEAAAGNDEEFLAAFARTARTYGERPLRPRHHLRAANLLLQRGQLTAAARGLEKFLAIYPDDPAAPRARYSLGLLCLRRLGQPGRGLDFLRAAVQNPGDGYPLATAQALIAATEEDLARITAEGKNPEELVAPCTILRRTAEPLDAPALGQAIARLTGQPLAETLPLLRAAGGIIARNLSRQQALALATLLPRQAIPFVILDRTEFHDLPEPERATEVELTTGGLAWRSANGEGLLRWEEVAVVAAGRLAGERQAASPLEKEIISEGETIAAPHLVRLTPERTARTLAPVLQIVVRETGFRVELLAGRTVFGTLATGRQGGPGVIAAVAAQLLESVDCNLSRPGLELVARNEPGDRAWAELTFASAHELSLFATALYFRKRYA